MSDFETEFLLLNMPDAKTMAWLRGRVPHRVLRHPLFFVKQARILDLPNLCFEFSDNGAPAFIIEVRDEFENVVDLAAWRPSAPHCVRTLLGRGSILGEGAVKNPATYALGRPLRVFRSPLTWLAEEGVGCVILNPGRAWLTLRDVTSIAGEDAVHSREIASLLKPRGPRVLAPEARAA